MSYEIVDCNRIIQRSSRKLQKVISRSLKIVVYNKNLNIPGNTVSSTGDCCNYFASTCYILTALGILKMMSKYTKMSMRSTVRLITKNLGDRGSNFKNM